MSLIRGFVAVTLAALAGGAVVGAAYAAEDGLLMALFLFACGAAVVAAVHLLERRRALAGSLSTQLNSGLSLSVGLTTLGVGAVALLMFISAHDALVMAVLLLFAGGLTAYSTHVLSGGAIRDVRALRDGLVAVGDGRRDVEISTGARDELGELAAAANRMTAQLAERESERDAADQARRALVAAVSHDLRTPLTSLRLLAQALEDDLVDSQTRRRYLEQMSLHVSSLSALVDDLFELSRLEAGDIEWSMQRVMLDELVAETVTAMRPHAAARQIAVEALVPEGLAPARANPEKLQRVLFNLIHNAIRHTPADGSVTVAAEANGTTVEVEVADTGEGLAPEERDAAFEPFYRGGPETARTGEGSGLGLTICRAIVEAHGGEIWFPESALGARVRFSVPRAS